MCVTIPEPRAGIFKALPAATTSKIMDASRRKPRVLTEWRTAGAGKLRTISDFILCQCIIYALGAWCTSAWSALEVA